MQTKAGQKIIILETANIEEIKKGRPAVVHDQSVIIAWTPDLVWLADKIMDADGDAMQIGRLVDEAAKRPQQPPRPHHEPHQHKFTKGGRE